MFCFQANSGFLYSILPSKQEEFFGDRTLLIVGVTQALFSTSSFFLTPIHGFLSDKYGRRPLLIINLLVASLPAFSLILTSNMWGEYIHVHAVVTMSSVQLYPILTSSMMVFYFTLRSLYHTLHYEWICECNVVHTRCLYCRHNLR